MKWLPLSEKDLYNTAMRNFFLYLLLLAIGAGLVVFLYSSPANQNQTTGTQPNEATNSAMKKTYSAPPSLSIDTKKKYTATMITSKGPMTLELFANETPNTVNNFVFLARDKFYDGTTFHRIVKDFMIQGGDPKGDGTGDPGYKFTDEKITRDYKRGIIAMANSGPNTNGSQFFIMHKDTSLPKNYVIFGQVTQGLETVDAIANVPTVEGGMGEQSKPTEKVTLQSVIIEEK